MTCEPFTPAWFKRVHADAEREAEISQVPDSVYGGVTAMRWVEPDDQVLSAPLPASYLKEGQDVWKANDGEFGCTCAFCRPLPFDSLISMAGRRTGDAVAQALDAVYGRSEFDPAGREIDGNEAWESSGGMA
jgi:hypothetical protein